MSKSLKYYFTSNFGGGGSNVSRVFNYYKLIKNTKINILLNYFYLETNFKKTPSFNTKELNILKNYNGTLINYLNDYAKKNIQQGNFSNKFKNIEGEFLPEVFLDSGAGNLLKELGYSDVNKKTLENIINDVELYFKDNVQPFLDFANKYKVNIVVGLDYAGKGTYKQKESHNLIYQDAKNILTTSFDKQKELIVKSIQYIKQNKFFPKLFIPIHGKTIEDYAEYFKKLMKLEKKENYKFDGFAIGGVTRYKTIEICKLLENLSKIDNSRTFHILGSSGIKKILNLAYSGASSFDCHTPWRRASDGEGNFLVPLLDKNLNFIGNIESLNYKKLTSLNDNLNCDCEVCLRYKFSDIKTLYKNKGEDNYFAKILMYFHWVHQYDRLLKKIEKFKNQKDYKNFIKLIPNIKLKNNILEDFEIINNYKRNI